MAKGILFDFDGTIIDTMFSFKKIAGSVINKYYDISIEEGERLYFETSGLPFIQQMEMIVPDGEFNKKVVDEFEQTKLDNFFDETFDKDVKDTLLKLKEKGYVIGVSSGNFTHLIEEFMKKEEVKFDLIMGFEKNFEKGKDHFEHNLNKTSIKKEDLIFVGDSIKDGERANDFGVKFIGREGIFKKERFQKEFGENQAVITKLEDIWQYI